MSAFRPAILFLFYSLAFGVNSTSSMNLDMTAQEESEYWQAINDNVMGGVSQGNIHFSDNYAVFSGEISLENNGGFTSVTRLSPSLTKGADKVVYFMTLPLY